MLSLGWWRAILHIETLFIAGAVICFVYFIWKYRSFKKGILAMEEAAGKMLLVPKELIKKKTAKKKRVNQHEERCREIFEEIFDLPFKTIRPDWLKNPVPGGQNLELDGYNSTIMTPMGRGLAFEYDGAQHSRYIPHFHRKGPQEFVYQVKKDMLKDKICKERNVMLIRIPSFVLFDDLKMY